jgi:tRNA threonylcarbamoyladenosine biosynthesis protein TsaB
LSEILLTIATATRTASVSITSGENLIAELTVNPPGTQSEVVLPGIEQLLSESGLSYDDLDAVSVVTGPGAFTGLRVGVATAKGLSMATGKPLIGVSSLQSLAVQIPVSSYPVCALIDARKGEVYAGCYEWQNGLPTLQGKEEVVDPLDIVQRISGSVLFVGDGCEAYRTLIIRQLGERAHFAAGSAHILRASSAARLALLKLRNGETVSPDLLNPVYIPPSDAEINSKTPVNSSIEG